MIHIVKGFGVVGETEVDVFLEFPSFELLSKKQQDKYSHSVPTQQLQLGEPTMSDF